MNCYFGIHLGNSNICLAVHKDGNVDVVANKAGDRVTPTALAILDSEEFAAGETAKQRSGRNPASTITNNLQFCNAMTEEEMNDSLRTVSCRIETTPNLRFCLEIDELVKEVTPFQVNVELFHNILSCAHQICHGEDENAVYPAVISIPDYFSNESSTEIARAAETAGFKVEQIISNGAAAALSYSLAQEDDAPRIGETVIMYRVGGLTAECSLIHIQNGLYEIEKTIHRRNLGGHIFTKALADFIATEFRQRYKLDPTESRRHMAKLFYYAEQSKHVLSTLSSTQVFIESLMDGVDCNNNISRARFESLITPHLSKFRQPIEELLADSTRKIDRVILCGGSMKMPKLQSTIADLFKSSEILTSIPPDEVIAIGCARQASLKPGRVIPDVSFTGDVDVIPHSIYIKKFGADDDILAFPGGTQVYSVFRFSQMVGETEDKIEFSIFEKGENDEVQKLGDVAFENAGDDKLNGNVDFVAVLKPTLVEISFEKFI